MFAINKMSGFMDLMHKLFASCGPNASLPDDDGVGHVKVEAAGA